MCIFNFSFILPDNQVELMARRQSNYETIGEETEEDHLLSGGSNEHKTLLESEGEKPADDEEEHSFISQFPKWVQIAITASLFMGGLNMVNISLT